MSTIRELTLSWLLNTSLDIALFAILAAVLTPFIGKVKARQQHWFYLAVLALSLVAPIFNTFGQTRSSKIANEFAQQPNRQIEDRYLHWLTWNRYPAAHPSSNLWPIAKTAILTVWLALFLYQLIHFSRALYCVHRLRRDASPISPSQLGVADSMVDLSPPVMLLQSKIIDDPITIGVFHPAIILPVKMIPALNQTELQAILAHEYGHIRSHDYLVHLLCRTIVLPVAWHPGILFLHSKISQTRELACDDYAAVRFGERLLYARTLLRLATLCLETARGNTIGLGIFNDDNLEDRIIMLTEKRTSLSSEGLLGLALATSFLFGSGTMLAHAARLQNTSASNDTAKTFAGTWHWMFQRKSFATMTLAQNGPDITGTVTQTKIALDKNGDLSKADPSDNGASSEILTAKLEGKALHVTTKDGFEFIVTLRDLTHAEIHPVGAPPNMKPIRVEKVN